MVHWVCCCNTLWCSATWCALCFGSFSRVVLVLFAFSSLRKDGQAACNKPSGTPKLANGLANSLQIAYIPKNNGGLVIFGICFAAGFFWGVPGSMLSCFSVFSVFSASLLFCFSASLLFCFLLSLLLCFSCFSAFLLFCFLLILLLFFSASLFSLLLCFCTSGPFYFYYSTFSFLQSCAFAALLPAPLLLCFPSLLSLCFSFSFALFILLCLYPKWNPRETLSETQRNP